MSWLENISFLQYSFMRYAFIATLIITPMFGMLGTMIVNRRMAFFSDALGHSALTGIAVGMVCGIGNASSSMILYGVAFALLLNRISRKNTASTDTIISVFSSCSIALGLAILSVGGNFGKYANLLVGDILKISTGEIVLLALVFCMMLLFWLCCFNKLHAISINRTLAKSVNINVALIENIFSILVAVIVMLSIRWVGILLINALLILPAAASRNLAVNMREYHLYSVIISFFSGMLGLVLSYYLNTASGPTIVVIASVVYFITYLIQ